MEQMIAPPVPLSPRLTALSQLKENMYKAGSDVLPSISHIPRVPEAQQFTPSSQGPAGCPRPLISSSPPREPKFVSCSSHRNVSHRFI